MNPFFLALLLASGLSLAVISCDITTTDVGSQPTQPQAPPPTDIEPAEASGETTSNIEAALPEELASGLDTPWAIDFLPDGRMIFTERPGRVTIMSGNESIIIAEPNVLEAGESGLLGIAVDPSFSENKNVFLYYTHPSGFNRVSRFTLDNQTMRLEDERGIVDMIPASLIHNGGRLKFGPDGFLYITTGDSARPSSAQDTEDLGGKILRVDKTGSAPADNPFRNEVWSYGHRNPQGIAWAADNTMFESEHGPRFHDEINIIARGANYGWPETCSEDPAFSQPIKCYPETSLAPGGMAIVGNQVYVAALRGNGLRRLTIAENQIVDEETLFSELGRIRDVVSHEGYIYFSTSNRDGRGRPAASDDRIFRLRVE